MECHPFSSIVSCFCVEQLSMNLWGLLAEPCCLLVYPLHSLSGPCCVHRSIASLLGRVCFVFLAVSTGQLKPWWKYVFVFCLFCFFEKWNSKETRITESPGQMLESRWSVLGHVPTSIIFFWTHLSAELEWLALATLHLFKTEMVPSSMNFPLFNSNSFHIIIYLCQPTLFYVSSISYQMWHKTRKVLLLSVQCFFLSLMLTRCQQLFPQTPSSVLTVNLRDEFPDFNLSPTHWGQRKGKKPDPLFEQKMMEESGKVALREHFYHAL